MSTDWASHGDDHASSPRVTPEPAPPDDILIKLVGAAAVGAAVGSLVVYRWLRKNVVVSLRPTD